MYRMTVAQVKKALSKNDYCIFRRVEGVKVGVNCKILNITKELTENRKQTNVIGFYPCSFQEYISHKTPFLTSKRKSL